MKWWTLVSRERQPSEIETPGFLVVEPQGEVKTFSEQTLREQVPQEQIKEELLLEKIVSEKTVKEEQVQEESSFNAFFSPAEEESSVPFENVKENGPLLTPSETLPFIGERSEENKGVGEIESEKKPAQEVLQERLLVLDTLPQLDASVFEEASRLINEISIKEEKREKGSSSFPWIEEFRNAVQTYSQVYPDAFTSWFRTRQSQHDLKDPFHSLLTLLVHARFDQMDETEKAIENTQRVYSLLGQTSNSTR